MAKKGETVKVTVGEAFTLNLPEGHKRFEVGEHEVSEDVADHWYTKLHLMKKAPKAEKPAPSGGAGGSQTGSGGQGGETTPPTK